MTARILKRSDLGYVSENMMEKTACADGYYLNRIKRHVAVYKKACKKYPYSFSNLVGRMQRNGEKYHEMEVFLTASDRSHRLILVLVPDSVYRQRLAQWKKENPGKKIGKEQKVRLHLNMYVTNLPSDVLAAEYVFLLYSIRWQIELMFKIWKSVFSLHTGSGMNTERYLTTLYAKLILVLLDWHIFCLSRKQIYKGCGAFLNPNKCMKHLYLHSQAIRRALRQGELAEQIQTITMGWRRLGLLERQEKERSYTKIMKVIAAKSG